MVAIPTTFAATQAMRDRMRQAAHDTPSGRLKPLTKECQQSLSALGYKRCPGCLAVRERSEFGSNTSTTDGLYHQCRICACRDRAGYRAANSEKLRTYAAEYDSERDANPARILQKALTKGRLRALKRGLPAVKIQVFELLAWWRWAGIDPCTDYYTGEPIIDRHLDHKDPLSREGSIGHVAHNIVPCNASTNVRKGKRTAEEFLAVLAGE